MWGERKKSWSIKDVGEVSFSAASFPSLTLEEHYRKKVLCFRSLDHPPSQPYYQTIFISNIHC